MSPPASRRFIPAFVPGHLLGLLVVLALLPAAVRAEADVFGFGGHALAFREESAETRIWAASGPGLPFGLYLHSSGPVRNQEMRLIRKFFFTVARTRTPVACVGAARSTRPKATAARHFIISMFVVFTVEIVWFLAVGAPQDALGSPARQSERGVGLGRGSLRSLRQSC